MNMRFEYEDNGNFVIDSISVIGDFNLFDPDRGKMEKRDDIWILDYNLPQGEYRYRFLINGVLELNDPAANIYYPDESEKLWSMIIINKHGERLYNNIQSTVHIHNYNINSVLNEKVNTNKKSFNLLLDRKVVTRFEFTDITGVHTVTSVWYAPNGKLFQIGENNLFKPEGEKEPIKVWFWMDLEEESSKYPEGLWTMKLFINGKYVLEDSFKLLSTNLYSSQGRINY